MSTVELPRLDFSLIPDEFQGQWVVVQLGATQRVIGHGKTATEALSTSGVDSDDDTVVLTQVPTTMAVSYMGQVATE